MLHPSEKAEFVSESAAYTVTMKKRLGDKLRTKGNFHVPSCLVLKFSEALHVGADGSKTV